KTWPCTILLRNAVKLTFSSSTIGHRSLKSIAFREHINLNASENETRLSSESLFWSIERRSRGKLRTISVFSTTDASCFRKERQFLCLVIIVAKFCCERNT